VDLDDYMDSEHRELILAARVAALRTCSMFADVPAGDIDKIAGFAVDQSYVKGAYLFREGEPARGFFIVRSGAVCIHRAAADGTENVIHVFRRGSSFAEGTIGAHGGYPASARAVEESELFFIPSSDFLELLRSDAAIALRIIGSLSQHLRLLVNAIEDLQGRDVETRLMNWLLKRCPFPRGAAEVELALDVTKTVLAAELGTRSETLSRALAKIRDAELIEVFGKRIRIPSPRRLEERFLRNLGDSAAR